MDYLMKVLMLTVVLFALTSAPAPVDRTEGLGVQVVEMVYMQGLTTIVAEMVLSASATAQEYEDSGSCEDDKDCLCFCVSGAENTDSWCHEAPDKISVPREEWVVADRQLSCDTWYWETEQDCQGQGFPSGVTECTKCTSFSCPSGNGGSNGGGNGGENGGGNGGIGGANGGALAAMPVAPSGVAVLESPALVVPVRGLVRAQCSGWVVGVTAAGPGFDRLVL